MQGVSFMTRKTLGHSMPGVVLAGLLGVVALPSQVSAQYFGQNKVQYETFKYETMDTKHFRIYFYPAEAEATGDAARMAERWYDRYSKFFNIDLDKNQPVILYANQPDFQQTNVVGGIISQGTGGVTEGIKNRVVLPLTGVYADNDHVLGHELVHAFQFTMLNAQQEGIFGGGQTMPLWAVEGMAEYLSMGAESPLTAMWMRDAVLRNEIPTINQVSNNARYFPYRYGHAIWAYIGGKYGDPAIADLFRAMVPAYDKKIFTGVLGISLDTLSAQWNRALRQTYGPQLEGKKRPEEIGEPLIVQKEGINLAPAISPDGKYVVFLGRRDLFSIDLYLADARTGKVIKRLVSSNSDAHFDALRFINSAGTWSPDGRLFAFPVFENGNTAIAILDVESRKVKKVLKIKEPGEIFSVAWSPDGGRIAFSASVGGMSDLYLYEVNAGTERKLTDDKYADLQPAWSPDGETIAFVTDRGPETNFETLTYSPMKIGLYNMATGEISMISLSNENKHINPQFSPDGRDIFMIADPDGFSDIYRYSIPEKKFYRVTEIATGVSGITELSPAMSVAKENGQIVFSVFQNMGYNIYGLTSERAQGQPYSPLQVAMDDDISLAPRDHGVVSGYLASAQEGLLRESVFKIKPYRPSLSLLYLGQATVGVSVDRFGTSLGGGVSAVFSDMLGNNWLGVAAQINGGLADIGAQVVYQNMAHRTNWGVGAGHIPYLTGFISSGVDTVTINGERVVAQSIELVRQRVFLDMATIFGDYPLSENRRIELGAGYTRIGYSADSERILAIGGQEVQREERNLPSPSALNLFQTSGAYVGDYSFFGFTSPVKGRAFRFEVDPTVGSLQYLTALADYRHYFFFSPFTLGFRALHIGRYLKDGNSDRLSSLFLGFETLVRGYSIGSFDPSEFANSADSTSLPVFDRLLVSRIGVFNAEFRIPLFGNEQFGLVNFPYLPTELAAFFDGGVAWSPGDNPKLEFKERSTERIPVFSAGGAVRMNLFNYLVAQIYWAKPFQRPEKTGVFGFVIAPGW